MKILLWHGYLLTGSGSNIYTANLARHWRRAGHHVLVLCQERRAGELHYVDAVGGFAPDNASFETHDTGHRSASGRCVVVRPSIGTLLPVYVYDEYEDFTVKLFVDLTDEELQRYTSANVDAMATAIERFCPDAIVTGHEVMGPYIARRACERTHKGYLAKLHGSALEYAVKRQDRYRYYARQGLCGAKVVTGGSRYMVAEAASVVPGWEDKAVVVNPGCDVELFAPRQRDPDAPPIVGFVGKLIVAKGVHNLFAALGLTSTEDLRAVIVGFGGYELQLRQLWHALSRADLTAVRSLVESGDGRPLEHLVSFLASGRVDDAYWRRAARIDVEFAGRLDHGPLSEALPTFDALVVPSVVAEAFGMVAAEAAACGVLPIVPRHSGIGEIGATLEEEMGVPGLLTYEPDEPVSGIAEAIDRVLGLVAGERRDLERIAVGVARHRWSWEHVAQRLLDLASHP